MDTDKTPHHLPLSLGVSVRRFRHNVLNERSPGGGYRAIPEESLDLPEILETAKKCDPQNVRDLVTHLAPLFFCFRNPSSIDLTCMQIMLKAIQSGLLEYRIEFVSTPPDVDQMLDSDGPFRGRTIESGEHKGMKRWLRKHLQSKGIRVAGDEVSYLGYEVDVGSLPDRIFIECGDTEPRKVFEFLRHGENLGILQYNAEDVAWFISSPDFQAFAETEWKKLL